MQNQEDVLHCPCCKVPIEIIAINCGIFRCGMTKYGSIPPHASKLEIDYLMSTNVWIGGCGAPLRYDQSEKKFILLVDKDGNRLYL